MTSPREHRPTFGWLHRADDPHRPLDGAVVQERWLSLYRPGPARAAAVIVLTLLTSSVAFLALLATGATVGLFSRLVVLVVGLGVLGLLIALTLRVLTAGVSVNDQGVRITGLVRARALPWVDVVDVRRVPVRARLLDVLAPRPAERVVLVRDDGEEVATPMTTVSSDFLARAEAFDIASLALERWWRDSQRSA
jgi:hypothetical protein